MPIVVLVSALTHDGGELDLTDINDEEIDKVHIELNDCIDKHALLFTYWAALVLSYNCYS